MNDNTRNWIEKAEEDRETCEILLERENFPISIVCYHSQQLAEKYIKAFLTEKEVEFPKVHDIVHLIDNFCINIENEFMTIKEDAIILSDYSILPRYPGDFQFINKGIASEAYQSALKIKELVLYLLEK